MTRIPTRAQGAFNAPPAIRCRRNGVVRPSARTIALFLYWRAGDLTTPPVAFTVTTHEALYRQQHGTRRTPRRWAPEPTPLERRSWIIEQAIRVEPPMPTEPVPQWCPVCDYALLTTGECTRCAVLERGYREKYGSKPPKTTKGKTS